MSYANHIVDESVDPKVALTAQQLITLALQRIATGTITPYAGDLDLSSGLGTGTGGADGADGVGIASVAINGSNHLIVTLTDNSTVDAGLLPSGPAGATGAAGSDGADGADGVGISSVAIDGSNHLIVTLTDASTVDAGLLPSGGGGIDGIISDPAAVTVDRGLILGLYDHTVPTGDPGGPPPAAVFRSTVDGRVYQRLANGATDLLNNPAAEYGGSSGGAGWGIVDGYYYYGGHTPHGTITPGVGLLYAVPLAIDDATTWTRIGCNVDSAGVAGSVVRLGIYGNANQFPTNLLGDAGEIDASSPGLKEATISLSLPAGKYWLVCRANEETLTLTANSVGSSRGQILPGSFGHQTAWVMYHQANTGETGALPATFPLTASQHSTESPRLWLRKV